MVAVVVIPQEGVPSGAALPTNSFPRLLGTSSIEIILRVLIDIVSEREPLLDMGPMGFAGLKGAGLAHSRVYLLSQVS